MAPLAKCDPVNDVAMMPLSAVDLTVALSSPGQQTPLALLAEEQTQMQDQSHLAQGSANRSSTLSLR